MLDGTALDPRSTPLTPRSGARTPLGRLAARLGFPWPPYAWRLVRSSFLAWLALRLFLGLAMMLGGHAPATPPNWRAAILLVLLPFAFTQLDMRILREVVWLRDLGGRPAWPVALALLAAGVPELLLDSLLHACHCT